MMRQRDIGFAGSLSPWPPQKCFRTLRMSIFGITTMLGGSNMYVAICEMTRKAMIVDFSDPNASRWGRALQQLRANVDIIVQTHGQDTQAIGLSALKSLSFFPSNLQIFAHPLETSLSKEDVDEPLMDGVILNVGNLRFKCLHLPGPSPGHCAFYEAQEGIAFTGDILSRGGRMTRAVSDSNAHRVSLSRLVREIPETTLLFPGHYGFTTMGAERRMNPNLMGVTGPPLLVPRDLSESIDTERKRKIKRWIM